MSKQQQTPPSQSQQQLSQADLLLFDGLLSSSSAKLSTYNNHPQQQSNASSQGTTDWFALLTSPSATPAPATAAGNASFTTGPDRATTMSAPILTPTQSKAALSSTPAPTVPAIAAPRPIVPLNPASLAKPLLASPVNSIPLASSLAPITASPTGISTTTSAAPAPFAATASAVPHPAQTQPIALLPSAGKTAVDDDFGDFVSSAAAPDPDLVPAPTVHPTPAFVPTTSTKVQVSSPAKPSAARGVFPPISVSKSKSEASNSSATVSTPSKSTIRATSPVTSRISTGLISPIPPKAPTIKNGVVIPPLQFGQHLVSGNLSLVNSYVSPINSVSPSRTNSSTSRTSPVKFSAASSPSTTSMPSSTSSPLSAVTSAPTSTSNTTLDIPSPDVLLSLFETNLFPLPDPLFKALAPLPFPLKRRVLSDAKTRAFFEAFLRAVEVAIRICAGRKRRGGRFEADKEAREIARQWRNLRERIAGSGLRDLPNVDASLTLRGLVSNRVHLCIVCGVANGETVRGCTRQDSWDSRSGGHSTCIKWWLHEKALLEG
ncbi:uncharacterized protein V1516DRAFT_188979 [Lipomyces oligophaga]|uniref:uncharacterized protein n=1 Tax=Lipomyces oligophaga TaxID=45792 RepID=UPI0034D01376